MREQWTRAWAAWLHGWSPNLQLVAKVQALIMARFKHDRCTPEQLMFDDEHPDVQEFIRKANSCAIRPGLGLVLILPVFRSFS